MKKTLFTIVALAMATTVAQAATVWTTTFDNANQATATNVTVNNSVSGVEGLVSLLQSKGYSEGSTAVSCDLKTTGSYGTNAAFLTPNINVQTGGSWTVGFQFTNNSDSDLTLNELGLGAICFNGSGEAQYDASRDAIFTVSGYYNEMSSTFSVTSEQISVLNNNSTVVSLVLGQDVVIARGDTLSLSVEVARGTQQQGSFFGLQSINFDYVAPVPEPATASLSLLGLAALMMRRRRA